MSKKTILISIVLILIFGLGLGYIWYYFNTNQLNIDDSKKITNNQKNNISVEERDIELFQSNNLNQLIKEKESDLEKNPKKLKDLIVLANAYLQKGSLEFKEKEYGKKGLDLADKILALDPKSSVAYYLKGYAYEIMQDYDKALENYNKSLELKETADILNQIGHTYDLMGKSDKALEFYKKAVGLDKSNLSANMNLARKNYSDGKLKEALGGFEYVYNNNSNSRVKAEAAYMLSQIYLSKDFYDLDKAEKYTLASKASDPKFPTAWVGLGSISAIKALNTQDEKIFDKNIGEALKDFNKAIELYPYHTDAHLQKARLLYILGDEKGAGEEYKRALDSVEKDIILMENDRNRIKKLIEDEIKFRKIKISSLLEKALIVLTQPSVVNAGCWRSGGVVMCSSRADAIWKVQRSNQGLSSNDPHYFNWKGTYAVCNNGLRIVWPTYTCTKTTVYHNITTLKDQTHTDCQDIIWGDWKKFDNKKEVRYGSGIRTVVDYRKKDDKVTKDKKTYSCSVKSNTTSEKIIDKGEKVDSSLRNDNKAVKYKTNFICKRRQFRDLKGNVTDDPTYPDDDDPTNPDDPNKWIPTDPTGKKKETALITSDFMWSTDKIHWHNNFDRLILLRDKNEPIYLKSSGACSQGSSFFKGFKFNLLETTILGKKQNKKYLGYIKKEKINDKNIVMELKPTNDAKPEVVFKQKVKGNYCNNADSKERELKVKIIKIKRQEI